jgi:hypothetical protein
MLLMVIYCSENKVVTSQFSRYQEVELFVEENFKNRISTMNKGGIS